MKMNKDKTSQLEGTDDATDDDPTVEPPAKRVGCDEESIRPFL